LRANASKKLLSFDEHNFAERLQRKSEGLLFFFFIDSTGLVGRRSTNKIAFWKSFCKKFEWVRIRSEEQFQLLQN
jgi:hypothetical protein